jgi:hypothetical protein
MATMNRMNHLTLIRGEVTHLPAPKEITMETAAVAVAAEKDQPALAEVHQDTRMMEEMAVMIIHIALAEVSTRIDVLSAIVIEDTQYQRPCIRDTILLALWKQWNITATKCMNAFSS